MAEKHTIYLLEQFQFDKLRRIENVLFGDGSHLTPDKRRDLANMLSQLLYEVEQYSKVQHEYPRR